jgi:hypothetical protein
MSTTYYFFGIPIISFVCITTTDPRTIEISIQGGSIIGLPYDTYQQVRQTAGWPDVVCGDE